MCETTLSMAPTASLNVASPASDKPWPLSKTLLITIFKGAVMRMPWRASAILELPLKVWIARYTASGNSCGAGWPVRLRRYSRISVRWLEVSLL
jgi:hypothetical protein